MPLTAPFVLLDDARDGHPPARLYTAPRRIVAAHDVAAIPAALAALRQAVAGGLHAAGLVSYEAGAAFAPGAPAPASGEQPLLWFGLFDGFDEVAAEDLLPDPAGAWIGAAVPAITRDAYDAQLARVQELIAAGDIYQANLTFSATAQVHGDPLAAYAKLRCGARAGWGALIDTGAATLLSLSPELFFALDAGILTCRPMKGTARRHADPADDAAAARTLASDAKQRAENLMIVDLMRNDLSRVAVAGSVAVPELFAVEHYPTVHQMVSTVTARIAPGRDAIDTLAALFPCGSITGTPKVRAMQVIGEVEGRARGLYTGAIGRLDPPAPGATGDAMFNVAIRTLTLLHGHDVATLGIGGGIVADSRQGDEWDEAMAKAAFLTHRQRPVDLIETMAFHPETGIALVERHLARLMDSAAAFGAAFDRHHARNELQAATFKLRSPARIRLCLAPSGAIAIEASPAPPPRDGAMTVTIMPLPVASSDFRLRHKTSDRAFYDAARKRAGTDEVVFTDPDGFITEGSFTNVFVKRGDVLVTPPLGRGLLPGVLRGHLIAQGDAVEDDLVAADLAHEFFVGNALRGLIRARCDVADAKSAAL